MILSEASVELDSIHSENTENTQFPYNTQFNYYDQKLLIGDA